MMREYLKFFIDGRWVDPIRPARFDVINPATESISGCVSAGSSDDIDRAVRAAREAFFSFSQTSTPHRIELLESIISEYKRRYLDMAVAITEEMGAPSWLSMQAQAGLGIAHLQTAVERLREFRFEESRGSTMLRREAIGVCGFITPWNWPMSQITAKVAPALAMGCTMILKPSELSPFSSVIYAEIMAAAGVPPGVFNLVNGDGPTAGAAIAAHPDIDLVSITGSTRAGIAVARAAAVSVKRVLQELGGKSPNIILEDADFPSAVTAGLAALMMNSGQSCDGPSRLIVPVERLDEVKRIAIEAASALTVGDPNSDVRMGPVVSRTQWEKIQSLIKSGLEEGATLITGGLGRPAGLRRGFYVKPTVFADVTPDMTIAREEIFGPVLAIISYKDEDQAVAIANNTLYGLAAYVQSADLVRARAVAAKIRAGQVHINYAPFDVTAPFGGYKQSGNGRERGDLAFSDYLETKAVIGYAPALSAP